MSRCCCCCCCSQLKQTQMLGRTGELKFTDEGDRLDAMYEIININTSRRHVAVGFYGGLQVSPTKVRLFAVFSMLPSACTVETAKCAAVRGRTVDVHTYMHTYVQVNPSLMLMLHPVLPKDCSDISATAGWAFKINYVSILEKERPQNIPPPTPCHPPSSHCSWKKSTNKKRPLLYQKKRNKGVW